MLLNGFLNEVGRGVAEHLGVMLLIAIILILIAYFRKNLINLSSRFVPVRVHGKWATTLSEPTVETSVGAAKTPDNSESQKTHEYVMLHQFFNKVWGDAFVQNETRDVYQVRGHLVGQKLSLLFRDKEGFDSGAIFLNVTHKEQMQGYEVGVDPAGNVYSRVYTWRREVDKFPGPSSAH